MVFSNPYEILVKKDELFHVGPPKYQLSRIDCLLIMELVADKFLL